MNKFLLPIYLNPSYLVFLRIATGAILMLSLIALWPDFEKLYGLEGLVDHQLLTIKQGYASLSIYGLIEEIKQIWQIEEQQILSRILIVYVGLCLLLIVGFFTKVAAFSLILLHGIIFTSLPQFSYGFDYFCSIALFYCLVFPSHRSGSLDRKLFKLTDSRWTGFCLRILQIHLCLVYFFSGLGKLIGHSWRNGEALWKTVQLPYFKGAFNFDALAPYPWLWIVGGWSIALLELLYPLFIFHPRTRKCMLALILALHLGIALVLGLYLFSAMMIALNIAAFYYPYLNTKKETYTLNQPINPLPIDSS